MTVGSLSRPTSELRAQIPDVVPAHPAIDRLRVALSSRLGLVAIVIVGTILRCWRLGAVGFNSDEAVYAGQAASIAGQAAYLPYFPIFRAHPLLFQSLLSIFYHFAVSDVVGRLLSVLFGVATLLVTYALGKLLYGQMAGLLAMLVLAVMPYHVIVSRQVLLDGPMVFFATSALYLLARYCRGLGEKWLVAAAAVMGLAILTKETAVVLLGGVYCFFMLTHTIRVRTRMVAGAVAVLAVVVSTFPLALRFAGALRSGGNYLAWQLFRRANHPITFYLTNVPFSIGLVVIALVLIGLVVARRHLDWREGLLAAWALVPIVFFTVMPIKGFQYLLPAAPVVAILAARTLASDTLWRAVSRRLPTRMAVVRGAAVALTVLSLLIPSWMSVRPSSDPAFLAGSGGLPGGREAGTWINENLPSGATFLTLGPSMANIVAFYGHRRAYGLSVSANPLNRNPSYEPIENADLQLRRGEIQYAVWDSFSAARSPSFSSKLLAYVRKYDAVAIHTETLAVNGPNNVTSRQPIVTIYEIRP